MGFLFCLLGYVYFFYRSVGVIEGGLDLLAVGIKLGHLFLYTVFIVMRPYAAVCIMFRIDLGISVFIVGGTSMTSILAVFSTRTHITVGVIFHSLGFFSVGVEFKIGVLAAVLIPGRKLDFDSVFVKFIKPIGVSIFIIARSADLISVCAVFSYDMDVSGFIVIRKLDLVSVLIELVGCPDVSVFVVGDSAGLISVFVVLNDFRNNANTIAANIVYTIYVRSYKICA